MKRFLPVLLIAAALFLYRDFVDPVPEPGPDTPAAGTTQPARTAVQSTRPASEPVLVDGRQAEGEGTVIRVLPDDNDGSRHQRFILQLASGRTLLIAQNIDLAPRIRGIREGDRVAFYGEFQSNPQGGVIHWTHHDPRGRHPGGWLRHEGRTYQ